MSELKCWEQAKKQLFSPSKVFLGAEVALLDLGRHVWPGHNEQFCIGSKCEFMGHKAKNVKTLIVPLKVINNVYIFVEHHFLFLEQ